MNCDSLLQVLEKTVSSDKTELESAQQLLEHAFQTNSLEFIKALSDVLVSTANSPIARTAAGLQIKNTLSSKDPVIKEQCQKRWLSFPEDARRYIKQNVLKSVGTEVSRPSSAAQCVAFIALIELPLAGWMEVIDVLCSNIIDDQSSDSMQEASLEAIGYICEDINRECLSSYSNNILTAVVVHGMEKQTLNKQGLNKYVGLAATNALFNSLEFTKANFENENERKYLMGVICGTTQLPDTQIRVAALQCLVKIMTLYYQYMEPYMAEALFPITLEAMKSDIDEIALQGIEFWSNVSEKEVDIALEAAEMAAFNEPSLQTSRFYTKGALQHVVPILIQKLSQQDELDDEDEWNPNKAASVCLGSLSSCCGEDIVPYVLPFVEGNIKNSDWRYRDASLMAFGSILGGLEQATLKPLVDTIMPTIIELMYDSNISVRDTSAWTIGCIYESGSDSALDDTYLQPLLEALVTGLQAEPRVAANVCWAFTSLAEVSYKNACPWDHSYEPDTYCLSKYFDALVEKLLETTNRADGTQANLRVAAFEALMQLITNSPQDCYPTVQKIAIVTLERLNQVFQAQNHLQNVDRSQFQDLQGLLCATLQNVLTKITPEYARKISDQVMTALIHMFRTDLKNIQEDALYVISSLAEIIGENFLKYMESFKPFLCVGLKNYPKACLIVGGLCGALKSNILPYCDEIMTVLLEHLVDSTVCRSVKPHILSVFGDIALAVGEAYKRYLDVVLNALNQASQIQVDRKDPEMVEYLNELRESIVDAYVHIMAGLKNENAEIVVEAHIPIIINLIKVIATDDDSADSTIGASAGLVGDLCEIFGARIQSVLEDASIETLLQNARKSKTDRTKNNGFWATKELRKLRNAAI